jgi:hypothetical protein
MFVCTYVCKIKPKTLRTHIFVDFQVSNFNKETSAQKSEQIIGNKERKGTWNKEKTELNSVA